LPSPLDPQSALGFYVGAALLAAAAVLIIVLIRRADVAQIHADEAVLVQV
jgi:hypothetical protein